MIRHDAPLPDWAIGDVRPRLCADRPIDMAAIPLPFGRLDAGQLLAIADHPGLTALRVTPWRTLLVEGVTPTASLTPDMPALHACVGAPACPQATVETRVLAERIAALAAGSLHVSGCAKGCACAAPTATVLTGRDGRFDLAHHARAGAAPLLRDLSPADVIAYLESRAIAP